MVLAISISGSGCGPVYETRYQYVPPATADGKVCANQCTQIESLCARNCRLEERACVSDARRDAERDYDHYVRERQAAHQPIDKTVNDFRYDYHCAASRACEQRCEADYRGCYQTCGGQVTESSVCTAFCQ